MNILRLSTLSQTLAIAVFALGYSPSFADTILESATLGPTGNFGGTSLDSSQYLGARFSTIVQVEVTAIGGHISDFGTGGLFGAIVRLSDPNALPTGSPVDADWLATTVFVQGGPPSSDVLVPLSVTLPPGDYALIFGSGQFGATGSGGMPSNNLDTAQASYFFWNGPSSTWVNAGFDSARFVVEGAIVTDTDGDGVLDVDDNCANTIIPESLPTKSLGVNRFALVDGDAMFDTTSPNGNGPGRSYSTTETAGCSCTQIIDALGLGDGHTKFGCNISAMDDWVLLVNP